MHLSPAQLGERAYYLAHARIGTCTSPELADSMALTACPPGLDRASWLIGWRSARELDLLDRNRYLSEAWIPLPGL